MPVDITQNLERYKPGYLGLTKEDIDQVNGELDAYFAKQKLGIDRARESRPHAATTHLAIWGASKRDQSHREGSS